MHQKSKNAIFVISLLLAIAILAWLFFGDIARLFSLATIQCYARDLIIFVHAHYLLSVLIYLLSGVIGVILFLPMVTLYMLTGGFLFGPWWGALYAIIGVTIGACCTCALIRATIGPWVDKYEKQLVHLDAFIHRYGFYAFLLLRAAHVVPFFLLNIAGALTPISLSAFGFSTLLGVIPSSLLFAWTGQYLCTINSIWDVISLHMLTIIGGILLIIGSTAFIFWILYKKQRIV